MRAVMVSKLFAAMLLLEAADAASQCTPPPDTTGADDGNPHCWDRKRRCDGPNAHPTGGPGYTPACGLCEGIGGIPFGDENDQITIPKCTPLKTAAEVDPRELKVPEWGIGNGGKFTIASDRFVMIGKKRDPFCFEFFPSNNSMGDQCYRRQTGKLYYDMSEGVKAIRYDLNIHIPWPSDKHSLFGNVTSQISHRGENMWIVNDLYKLVKQCVCTQPLSTSGHGSYNNKPIFPVMYNWTNHLKYVGRENIDVEYGVGPLDLEHWTYGPHHAWTKVGDNKLVRMWQPYNGFEVFEPGSWKDGIEDPSVFDGISPPAVCVKGGAPIRIGCDDKGFPKPKNESSAAPATASDLKRARTKVPRKSHKGFDFADMSSKLNRFIRTHRNAKECAEWTAKELQQFQAAMLLMRHEDLDTVYRASADRRQLRGDHEAHGGRWERLTRLAQDLGGAWQDMHRDGHCHEAVMWFVHHLSEPARQELAEFSPIPMLPYGKHVCPSSFPSQDQQELCDDYLAQVSCQDCHQDATAPRTASIVV